MMKKTWMSPLLVISALALPGAAVADHVGNNRAPKSYNGAVSDTNAAIGAGESVANSGISDINSGLFGLIDSFAPGSGDEGSGSSTSLSTTPHGGAPTLLAGGKIGINPYTENCDTSQFASAVAESVGKVGYRPSLSSNVCGIGGLSNINLPDLRAMGDEFLQKAFCSAVDMVASPVIDTANGYISQAEGMTGIDYFNQLSNDAYGLSNIPNAIDKYDQYSSSGNSGSPTQSSSSSPSAKNTLTELSWSDVGSTRSMDLGAEDILSVRFTVPEDATNVSGNFNVGGTGRHDVVVSTVRGGMAGNASCRVSNSANATVRFVTGAIQFGRCALMPGETYFLNVRQADTAGRAAIRLFHN